MLDTAWVKNDDVLIKDMIDGALALKPGWQKLEFTDHYIYLKQSMRLYLTAMVDMIGKLYIICLHGCVDSHLKH